ncbi:flavin-binding monooxygenase [Sphaerisporangium krabiense]|uniref:Cation diffusion facilitator CzcD-associated flavoprotein CzcO n=1 Tax=Sphaerisporangium krabiense TaxID=763782 RepID=A0A7W9DTN0_9ACTN|nr:NAD(P)/FAD-dependent oxidoreductase [Sphaerisporangium krabiense]MBB5630339.1 cation diffusion facilitator CzcD-associated flavoprotein CzcO [Sphaerisporangium krabiense]GII62710.1 flavin-binding monooxygenase [Sphaerisporangium krabiense]
MALNVAIIGAGFGGLCMAIQLRKAGVTSYTIFEKAERLGGTWRDNTYPGAACDVPSHLYSYSFEQGHDWSRRYPRQPEILAYLDRCAGKYGVHRRLRLGAEVTAAVFDEAAGRWRVTTADGEHGPFDVVVSGVGQLNRPRLPDIPGLGEFEGTSFHSARWDHGHDLAGRRVAVIGNGSSAAQFIPRVAPVVARLDVYQRTPSWVIPKPDGAYGPGLRAAFRHLPPLRSANRRRVNRFIESVVYPALVDGWSRPLMTRRATEHLRKQVPDPALRARLTPAYPIGCKRIVLDDDYYPALTRPNVEVVTDPITRVTRHGIETAGGTLREVDTIIFATGFLTTDFLAPIEVVGRGGRRLGEAWKDGAEAYLGMAVPGFPNLFLLYGPNTNLGHNSIILMIEAQVRYIMGCLPLLGAHGPMEVRPAAMDAWRRALEGALARTVWQADCASWYKNAAGRVTNNWPGPAAAYRRITRSPRPGSFTFG